MRIDEAYARIKEMIFRQDLALGQKLTYGDLGRTLRMSPTPIINALYRLEHEGLVESLPFRGFRVRKMGLQEIWDLFGLREALETWAVEQVILVASPAEMPLLEEKFNRHAAYRPKVYDRKRFHLDSEFHLQLASMARNAVLARRLAAALEHFYIRFRFEAVSLDRLRSSVEEHRQILDRIRGKDIGGARAAVRFHIQNARNHILQSLGDDSVPERASRRQGASVSTAP